MPFFASNPLLVAVTVLGIVCIVLIVSVFLMYAKLRRFLVGIDSENIKDSLTAVDASLESLESFRGEMEKYLTTVEKRLKQSVQAVHTVRFNPFQGQGAGGDQSFATALLDERGDGVIISSIYARDHVSVFAKPVKNHESQHELSDEEKEALDKAKDKLK